MTYTMWWTQNRDEWWLQKSITSQQSQYHRSHSSGYVPKCKDRVRASKVENPQSWAIPIKSDTIADGIPLCIPSSSFLKYLRNGTVFSQWHAIIYRLENVRKELFADKGSQLNNKTRSRRGRSGVSWLYREIAAKHKQSGSRQKRQAAPLFGITAPPVPSQFGHHVHNTTWDQGFYVLLHTYGFYYWRVSTEVLFDCCVSQPIDKCHMWWGTEINQIKSLLSTCCKHQIKFYTDWQVGMWR